MEEIITHVYSDGNLTKLSNKFASMVDDFGNTEEAMQYCKLWLKKKMKDVIDVNKSNIRSGGNKVDIIKGLNKQCLITAINEYRKKSGNSGKANTQKINQYKMNRETEIYGSRKNKVDSRPMFNTAQKDSLGTINDSGGFASFNSLDPNK